MANSLKEDFKQVAYRDGDTFSHSKLWSNIGKFVMTVVFIAYCYKVIFCSEVNKMEFSAEFILLFIVAVIFPNLLSKFIEKKYGCKLSSESDDKSSVQEEKTLQKGGS